MMDVHSVLETLRQTDEPPLEVLARAYEQSGATVETTLPLLEAAAAGGELTKQDANLLFWGLHILACARDTRAYAPLLRLIGHQQDSFIDILGETIGATLAKIVVSVFDGEAAPLFDLLLDSTLDDDIRQSVFDACGFLCAQERIAREVMHANLVRFDDKKVSVEGQLGWTSWELTIAILGFRDLLPRVEAARADGRTNPDFSDPTEFDDLLDAAELRPNDRQRYDPDVVDYMTDPTMDLLRGLERREGYEEVDPDDSPRTYTDPYRNPFKTVGRNDPCFCGSGKKFKKCCLPKLSTGDPRWAPKLC